MVDPRQENKRTTGHPNSFIDRDRTREREGQADRQTDRATKKQLN